MELLCNFSARYDVLRVGTSLYDLLSFDTEMLCKQISGDGICSDIIDRLDTIKCVLIIFIRDNSRLDLDQILTSRHESPICYAGVSADTFVYVKICLSRINVLCYYGARYCWRFFSWSRWKMIPIWATIRSRQHIHIARLIKFTHRNWTLRGVCLLQDWARSSQLRARLNATGCA